MGEMIEFASNGGTGQGYLALPEGGQGPGLVVIQEWWGLVPHIKEVADRFAGAGFVALAPDLYHGQATTEPDEAAKAMMALKLDTAGKDLGGAIDEVARRSSTAGIGVIGFCMGGGLALLVACQRPDRVKAVVPCYGVIPWPDAQPDYSALSAAVLIHCAASDGSFPPEQAEELRDRLKVLGKDVEVIIHPGADHAFFNDARPEVYHPEAARRLWDSSVAFFLNHLS
ncbi:MAG TPA: dienelactone hydrolase family protein [Acidimicrobiales bacterium]|nr:dienelactone hydrolase family protein [Acidimicrobiales bacterium]